jgi:hypothetical protein
MDEMKRIFEAGKEQVRYVREKRDSERVRSGALAVQRSVESWRRKGHAQKKGRSVRYGTGLKKYLELTVPTTKE